MASNSSAKEINSHISASPRFIIRPPTTGGDDGRPSESLLKDVRRILALIQDERHLCAYTLYQSVQTRLKELGNKLAQRKSNSHHRGKDAVSANSPRHTASNRGGGNGGSNRFRRKGTVETLEALASTEHEHNAAKDLLQAKAAILDKLENRSRLFLKAKRNLEVDDDWILSQTLFGVTTYYRREPDNSLSIKLEGELKNVPVFEQICVLKEVDLHCQWAPFCSSSMTIEELDKLDMVGWFVLGLPHLGLARDGCFRAIGCDSMAEDGSFLLVGQGVRDRKPDDPPPEDSYLSDDPVLDEIDIPDPPTSIGSGRMTIRKFEAVVHVLSPTTVRTRLVANVNPNLKFIPQSLLDFLMKKLCGVMLLKLQGAAKKILKNPVRNPHARRMRENSEFYEGWLMPKIQYYCQAKGWEIPKVSAFQVMDLGVLANGTSSAALLQFHSASEADEEMANAHGQTGRSLLRAHSAPVLDFSTSNDSDAMSGISTVMSTDTTKTSNPIMVYLKEVEEKSRRKKEEKVTEARQRAAARLKPKDFSTDQHARLEELKKAKARRLALSNDTNPNVRSIGTSSTSTSSLGTGFESLGHTRGQQNRLLVILALVTMLFGLLYSHSLMNSGVFLTRFDERWISLGQGLSTIVYVGMCALIHFYLSEVVLVYAFDSLELGVKTGFEARKYYNDNIRIAVAAISVGIVVLSLTRALIDVGVRSAVWWLIQFFRWFQPQIRHFPGDVANQVSGLVPSLVLTWGAAGQTAIWTCVQLALDSIRLLVMVVFGFFYEVLIASNIVGSTSEFVILSAVNVTTSFVRSGETFVTDIIRSCEGELDLPSWRAIAVDTSRALFSYTSVFLLATVTLFKFMVASWRSKPQREKPSASTIPMTNHSESTLPSTLNGQIAMISQGATSPRKMNATSARYEAIQEEEESDLVAPSSLSSARVTNPREVKPTVVTSQEDGLTERVAVVEPKRRRIFPRFRRKTRSTRDTETSPNAESKSRERRRFQKSVVV